MKTIVVILLALTTALSSQAECLMQISGKNKVSLRSSPDRNSPVVRELNPKTIVQEIKVQTQGSENWLQINQPALGWIPLKSITMFCGETSQEETANVNSLKVRGMAGDTRAVEKLAYFLYKGASGEVKDITIEALEAVAVANPIAVISVLDNQVEVVRRGTLKVLKKSAQAKAKIEETLTRYRSDIPSAKTWKSIQ